MNRHCERSEAIMGQLRAFALAVTLCGSASAVQIQAIKVSGETTAEVSFLSDGALPATPGLRVEDNRVELSFPGIALSTALINAPDITSPHALLQKISSSAENGTSRVRLVVNGSSEKLRDRVKLQKTDTGVKMVLTYPLGGEATMKLLQEEQVVLETPKPKVAESKGGFGWVRLILVLFVFAGAALTTWYFMKFARTKSGWRGTRRHLIETIANAPVGAGGKASVAILRVGSEFVMVGVTPGQVTFLSNLPRLQAQYEEENSLERDSFKEAIAEQSRRGGVGLSA